MSSSREYLEYITDGLPEPEMLSYRSMMGEYILYYRGKVIGGIYDNRLLIKPTTSAKSLLPDAALELPYEGAKKMLLVEETDNKELLTKLFRQVSEELPAPKKKHP